MTVVVLTVGPDLVGEYNANKCIHLTIYNMEDISTYTLIIRLIIVLSNKITVQSVLV